jgi:hypothetical protein
MAKNEVLVIEQPDVGVVFTPSEITITEYEVLEKALNDSVDRAESLIVTEENYKDSKKVRTELNKRAQAFNRKRIDVKKEYSAPLVKFEEQIKYLENIAKAAVTIVDEKLNEVEEQRKSERLVKVLELIEELAPTYEVEPDQVEVRDSWLNASSFDTTKKRFGEPTEELKNAVAVELMAMKGVKGGVGVASDVLPKETNTIIFEVSHPDMKALQKLIDYFKQDDNEFEVKKHVCECMEK